MSIRNLLGYVYVVKANDLYKIGSTGNMDRRLAQLRTASPYLEEVSCIPCLAFRELEHYLHALFSQKREAGEWFSLDENDLDLIGQLDWNSFPAEVRARQQLDDLYGKVMEQVKALPADMRETLKARLIAGAAS